MSQTVNVILIDKDGFPSRRDYFVGASVTTTPKLGEDLIVIVDGKVYNLQGITYARYDDGSGRGFAVRTAIMEGQEKLFVRIAEGIASTYPQPMPVPKTHQLSHSGRGHLGP